MSRKPLSRPLGLLAVSAASLALSACASSGATSTSTASAASNPRPPIRQPITRSPKDPTFQRLPGLEGVIGANTGQLVRQFGEPRLNVHEGDSRKLQYVGQACVLDIYLYPTENSPEPVATYVDARRASDGKDVDRAACVRALKR